MKFQLKNTPRLQLNDLLRRRKMTLRQLLDEFGITTYESLIIRCDRMGCAPPSEREFNIAYPQQKQVNSPTEGVVVVEPPPVIDEISGNKIDPDAPVAPCVKVIVHDEVEATTDESPIVHHSSDESGDLALTTTIQKKQRKKKVVSTNDIN